MCRKKDASLNKLATAAAPKNNFHAEKLKSLAFKMLMSAFRNNYYDVVPLQARAELKGIHLELLEFLKTSLQNIPKLSTSKTVGGKADQVLKKPKFYDLFGFYSYNKAMRKRIFMDSLFSKPLLLFLEHYTEFKSKFKFEFLSIFDEFKAECRKYLSDFNSFEEIIQIECDHYDRFENENVVESFMSFGEVNQPAENPSETENIKEAKLRDFFSHYVVNENVTHEAYKLLESNNFTSLFRFLTNNVEHPLTVPTLNQVFELYLRLLRIKYRDIEEHHGYTGMKTTTTSAQQSEYLSNSGSEKEVIFKVLSDTPVKQEEQEMINSNANLYYNMMPQMKEFVTSNAVQPQPQMEETVFQEPLFQEQEEDLFAIFQDTYADKPVMDNYNFEENSVYNKDLASNASVYNGDLEYQFF